jgi:NodT family efflux transporter outer membrane factor (OMF) lipoprotein
MPTLARAVRLGAFIGVIVVQGCLLGPNYVEPEIATADAWQSAVATEMNQARPPITFWWESLNDPILIDLVRRAEVANLDLRAAVARVREARAQRGVARGSYFPDVTLGGAYSYTRLSENSPAGQIVIGPGGTIEPEDSWQASADVFWEIDLFGRIRRQNEAASAQFQASVEDYRDVLVTLYAEVAAAYVDVRTFQTRLAFARQNAELQRETVQLTRDRFDAGLVSGLDVSQAETNLAATEAEIPTLESALNSSLNRVAVLLGEQPGTLHAELDDERGIPVPPDSIATGLPAELLRRRPDIRRAERLLASQTALIGAAKADLFPSFSLTGILELFSPTGIGDLFSSEGVGWSLVPGVRWNIFSGGKVRNNIKVQEARTEQLLYAYEQSVLLALEEVENALVAFELEKVRRRRLADAVGAAQRSVDIVRTRYLSGLTDFQRYLDSERALFQQQDLLSASEGQVVRNLIGLNKALGGGWVLDEVEPDRQETAAVNAVSDEATVPENGN